MTDTRDPELMSEEGRPAAAVVWLLLILGVVSAGIMAVVGLVVAYGARGSSQGWVRSHFNQQIRIFWQSFWFHFIIWAIVILTLPILIGFALWPIAIVLSIVVQIWVTVKSVFGLIRLIEAKPAA